MSKYSYHKIIFSSDNFEQIQNVNGFNFSVIKENDKITIKFNHTYSTNFFYYKYGNRYWLSFDEQTLADYLIEHNLIKGIIDDRYIKSNKITIVKFYNKYPEITCEDKFFSTLELYKDHFDINYCWSKLLYIPIRECGSIVQNWVDKYKKHIGGLDPEDLIMEISGGIDTRSLTYFWRNTGKKYYIYTKNDPNELPEALEVIKKLPCKEYTSEPNSPIKENKIILSGMCNISVNHFTDLYDFRNYIGNRRITRIINDLVPYYDKEYLQIKGDYVTQLKTTINYLLCKPDNLHLLPYKTFRRELFTFDKKTIKKCEEIIKCWNVII